MENYTDINAATIDQWVEDGWEWGVPISHQAFEKALNGEWDVLLTPTKPVPHQWFGNLKGKRLLGLACGGGQQMPIFTALGAVCTVLDYSQAMLRREYEVGLREGYTPDCVRADMTKPLPFPDETFDIIFNPVSNCYVHELEPIWQECARVLKSGGILLVGFDNGVGYLFGEDETEMRYTLPFNPLVNEVQRCDSEQQNCGMQFSHTIDEEIGGMLRAGFTLTHIFDDTNGVGNLHDHNVPLYYAVRCVKTGLRPKDTL